MGRPATLILALLVLTAGDVRRPDRSGSHPRPTRAPLDTGAAFVLSSLASTYPLAGLVAGRVTVGADSIRVALDSAVVHNRLPGRSNAGVPLDTVEIRAAVGAPDRAGWRVEALGPPALLAPALASGGVLAVAGLRLAVARAAGAPLAERWLVFELRARHRWPVDGRPPGPFATYICSGRNLAGPPSASAARAAALVLGYIWAC